MSLLIRFLDAVSDFNKNLRDHEVQSVPQQFRGGAVYTDPLTKQTVETPIFDDDSNVVGCIAWLIAAPFVLVAQVLRSPRRPCYTATARSAREHELFSLDPRTEEKSLSLHKYFNDNEDPFVLVGGDWIPRELAEMYERARNKGVLCGDKDEAQGVPTTND